MEVYFYSGLIQCYDINHGELCIRYTNLFQSKEEAEKEMKRKLEELIKEFKKEYELDEENKDYIDENFHFEEHILTYPLKFCTT